MGALNRSVVAPLTSAILTVLIAGLVVAGVDSVDRNKVAAGTARLEPSGLVEVSVAGAPFVRAQHGRTLRANDQVRVIDGKAVLELGREGGQNSKVELRAGSVLTIHGKDEPTALSLDDGDLLVESGRGDTVVIDGGTAVMKVAGAAKLRRGVSLAAGVYTGTARFERNDQGLNVTQYRQAAVVGTGILPPAAGPLSLSPSDEWDRRMLGPVMALDEQLTLITKAFEADAPAAVGPDTYKEWVPRAASLPLTPELLTGRAVGENLIGVTLVALDKGDFTTRFQAIFGFRAEGASWGLVAADRAINPNPVLGDLEAALGKAHPDQLPADGLALGPIPRGPRFNIGGPFGGGGGGGTGAGANGTGTPGGGGIGGTGGGGTGGTGGGGTGGSGGSGGNGGGGTGGGGGGGSSKLIDVPPTGTFLDPLLDPLVTPVEDLLSGLLGGLLGQGTPTSPSGSGSTSTASPIVKAPTTVTTTAPQPTATATASTGSGTTVPAPTATTTTTTAPSSGGLLGTVTGLLSPTTTTTTAPPTTVTTTSPSGSGLLGGIVGGLTKTVGGIL
jgi:hypothetical protein